MLVIELYMSDAEFPGIPDDLFHQTMLLTDMGLILESGLGLALI